jgi:hypothetical protein
MRALALLPALVLYAALLWLPVWQRWAAKAKPTKVVPARLGEILPVDLQALLELSEEQRVQVDLLHRDIHARLEELLTPEQVERFEEEPYRGPGHFDPPPHRPVEEAFRGPPHEADEVSWE